MTENKVPPLDSPEYIKWVAEVWRLNLERQNKLASCSNSVYYKDIEEKENKC